MLRGGIEPITLMQEAPKQAGAFYDKDTSNWYIIKDNDMVVANAGEIAKAQASDGEMQNSLMEMRQKSLISTVEKKLQNAKSQIVGKTGNQLDYWTAQVAKIRKKN